jgi:hypothetical protein
MRRTRVALPLKSASHALTIQIVAAIAVTTLSMVMMTLTVDCVMNSDIAPELCNPDVNGLLCSLDSDEQFADDFFSFPAGLPPGDSPD